MDGRRQKRKDLDAEVRERFPRPRLWCRGGPAWTRGHQPPRWRDGRSADDSGPLRLDPEQVEELDELASRYQMLDARSSQISTFRVMVSTGPRVV
jgi:hypothetical protein